MKKIIFIIVLLLITVELLAQNKQKSVITGQVVDSETNRPIPNINIFLAYTTLGTITNKDGRYIIRNVPMGLYNLVVSHISYEIQTTKIELRYPDSLIRNFKLKPRVIQGKEVYVEAAIPSEWIKNFKIFEELIIGKTENAKKCQILNPEVINFKTDTQTKELAAFSDSIICMKNSALGYHIDFIIELFSWNPKTKFLKYSIIPQFKPFKNINEDELKKWENERNKTYESSFRHFIKSIALGKLKKEKFILFYSDYPNYIRFSRRKPLDKYRNVILFPDTLGLHKFKFYGMLYCYDKKRRESWLELQEDYIYVDTLGNCYDELNIIKRGFWGNARLADTLPLDYNPNKISGNNYYEIKTTKADDIFNLYSSLKSVSRGPFKKSESLSIKDTKLKKDDNDSSEFAYRVVILDQDNYDVYFEKIILESNNLNIVETRKLDIKKFCNVFSFGSEIKNLEVIKWIDASTFIFNYQGWKFKCINLGNEKVKIKEIRN